MIVLKTENPDEMVKNLSDYYLLDNCFAIITIVEEIDEEFIKHSFQCKKFKNKFYVNYPLLILTKSDEVIEYLDEKFIFNYLNGIESIHDTSEMFIQSGFLPIDKELIKAYVEDHIEKYIKNDILNENEHYIFHLFKDMGYLTKRNKYVFEVTDKMINTLSNTNYAAQLIVLKNNCNDEILLDKKYIKAIYEILKLIDINIFVITKTN